MSKQPEALRLASVPIVDRSIGWQSDATIELRRQHKALISQAALTAELREAAKELHDVLVEAMRTGGWVPTPVQSSFHHAWINFAAAITKSEQGEQHG